MLTLEYADSVNLPEVIRLYERNGYSGGVTDGDLVILAKLDNIVVGAVRLCSEFDVLVLRGMQVSKDFQRQSIGSQMLRFCITTLNQRLSYCLPYRHLTEFYGQVGFRLARDDSVPGFLNDRASTYRNNGQHVVAMMRCPGQ